MEDVMKIVGVDPGKRVNPVVGLREAKQHGDHAAFSEDTCLGVLAAGEMPPRLLDTTHAAFQIMSGARQQGWLEGLKEMGRQGQGHRLHVGHHIQQFVVRAALLKVVHQCQPW